MLSLSLFDKTKIQTGKLIKKKKSCYLSSLETVKKFGRQIFGEEINSSITEK